MSVFVNNFAAVDWLSLFLQEMVNKDWASGIKWDTIFGYFWWQNASKEDKYFYFLRKGKKVENNKRLVLLIVLSLLSFPAVEN